MLDLGKEFDLYGQITLTKKPCDLCHVNFYFLKSVWIGKKQKHYCHVCNEAAINGVIPISKDYVPPRIPQVMMIFAGLGIIMMVLGFIYTMTVASSDQGNLLSILFGSTTTGLGFVLFKKTMRSRSLILGKAKNYSESAKAGYQK